jgi:hypothetical protein
MSSAWYLLNVKTSEFMHLGTAMWSYLLSGHDLQFTWDEILSPTPEDLRDHFLLGLAETWPEVLTNPERSEEYLGVAQDLLSWCPDTKAKLMLLDEDAPTEYLFRTTFKKKGEKYGPILWVPPYRCTGSIWKDGIPDHLAETAPIDPVEVCPTCGWPILIEHRNYADNAGVVQSSTRKGCNFMLPGTGKCHFDHR